MAFMDGGEMSTTVTIGGNSAPLQEATKAAAEAMTAVGASVEDAATLSKTALEAATQAIRDYTEQLSLTRESMVVLADASSVMGDSFRIQAQQWLAATTSAEDYAARLSYVREQIAVTQTQQAQMAESGPSAGSLLTGLFGGDMSGIFGAIGLGDLAGPAGAIFGAISGGIGNVVDSMGQFISQSASFVTAMIGWTVIQDVASWVSQLSDELFNLQVQTQRLDTGWSYLFGGGPQAGGKQASTDLMTWSSQYSMHIPFTRQDLMSAMTSFGARQWSEQQVEQFMPTLSDLAATYGSAAYGGRGTTLAQAAQAVVRAQEGMSKMIKYDLNIDPQELVPYGLQMDAHGHITDPDSLPRALENFAQAKGVAGASQGIVGSTWWGGASSLQDNIQNFLLNMGGTNLDGSVRQGSFFANLQGDLQNLLQWFNDHQDQLQHFADIASRLLGDVVSAGGGMLGHLAQWLEKLGIVSDVEQGITSLDQTIRQWFGLDDGKNQQQGQITGTRKNGEPIYLPGGGDQSGPPAWIKDVADAAGKLATISWEGLTAFIQGIIQNGPTLTQIFDSMARDAQIISQNTSPQELEVWLLFFKGLGMVAGTVATLGGLAVTGGIIVFTATMKGIGDALSGFVNAVMWLHDHAPWLLAIADPVLYLATSFNQLATALDKLNHQKLPDWLKNLQGASGNVGGGGGHSQQAQAKRTPGGFNAFGLLGA